MKDLYEERYAVDNFIFFRLDCFDYGFSKRITYFSFFKTRLNASISSNQLFVLVDFLRVKELSLRNLVKTVFQF